MKNYVGLFFLVLALIGCSDRHSKIRGEFLSGCIHSGTSKSICSCAFEKMENQHGDQLENWGPAQLSPLITQSLLECRDGQSSSTASPGVAAGDFETAFKRALASPTPASSNGMGTNASISGAGENTMRQALGNAIADQVNLRTRYGGGTEYLDGRKIIETDVNRDGSRDAVVLYAIEGAGGGNAVVQTLQLFFGSQGSYVAQGSTIVEGAADIMLGGDGSILVHSRAHGPHDPDCCPSIKSSLRYRAEGNQLLLVP